MKDPIVIHPLDSPEQARARHLEIQDRLQHFGKEQVQAMFGHMLPDVWNPIIRAFLAGDLLEKTESTESVSRETSGDGSPFTTPSFLTADESSVVPFPAPPGDPNIRAENPVEEPPPEAVSAPPPYREDEQQDPPDGRGP